ncbi:MAG: hypothetical protein ACYCS4_08035, partial [Acidimicrobiales bacterium]
MSACTKCGALEASATVLIDGTAGGRVCVARQVTTERWQRDGTDEADGCAAGWLSYIWLSHHGTL